MPCIGLRPERLGSPVSRVEFGSSFMLARIGSVWRHDTPEGTYRGQLEGIYEIAYPTSLDAASGSRRVLYKSARACGPGTKDRFHGVEVRLRAAAPILHRGFRLIHSLRAGSPGLFRETATLNGGTEHGQHSSPESRHSGSAKSVRRVQPQRYRGDRGGARS